MKMSFKIFFFYIVLALFACNNNSVPNPCDTDPGCENIDDPVENGFAKGADVGWITEMEAAGRKFYNTQGEEMECLTLLKSLGINSIRLRVWVDAVVPSTIATQRGFWCNKEDVIAKAKRANALDMRLMINFHYSDWWADPGKQNIPTLWKDFSFEELKNAVSEHTIDILSALKNESLTPEWVQIGNETDNGLLWDTGKASVNMKNYAELMRAGYDASKSIFPDTKVIIHVSNGYDNGLFRWNFDGLKNNGAKWDVIGMSLYPYWARQKGYDTWQKANDACIANIKDMIKRYDTEVMICEVGMHYNQAEECKKFLTDLINQSKLIPDNKVLGVFYWEPQSYNWKGYDLGAFDRTGKPTVAMDAFK